jgi:hypothetical protein
VAPDTEVAKTFRLDSWGEVCTLFKAMSDPTAVVYDAVVLYKLKADGRDTCHVAASRPLGRPPIEPPAAAVFSSVAGDIFSSHMRANILYKFLPCTAYLRERDVLFNVASV